MLRPTRGATTLKGIESPHSGLHLYYSTNCTIDNVNVHSFGYCGLIVHAGDLSATSLSNPVADLKLKNSKFNNNGCTGFNWSSQSGVFATNCQFNSNGVAPITTLDPDGLHIESFATDPRPINGHFSKCEFKFNHGAGAGNTFDYTPFDYETDYTFTNCLFVGGESGLATKRHGNPICMKSRRTHFECCDFVGPINYGYDAEIFNVSSPNNDQTIFESCTFNEEYSVGGISYSFTQDCPTPNPDAPDYDDCDNNSIVIDYHQPMVWLGNASAPPYSRVTFNRCTFTSNYNDQICFLGGKGPGIGGPPWQNFPVVANCTFINNGLNVGNNGNTSCISHGYSGNIYLLRFYKTRFQGINKMDYCLCDANYPFSVRNNSIFIDYIFDVIGCYKNTVLQTPDLIGNISPYQNFWEQFTLRTGAICPFAPCHKKYTNPESLELVNSDPNCTTGTISAINMNCSGIGNLNDKMAVVPTIQSNNVEVSPVPSNNHVWVTNLTDGNNAYLYDIFGNIVFSIKVNGILELNLEGIVPGIYIISDGIKPPAKIIKSNEIK